MYLGRSTDVSGIVAGGLGVTVLPALHTASDQKKVLPEDQNP